MRYAIHFTPPAHDPLTLAAAQWLGRNAFSGEAMEAPPVRGIGILDIAFHTAVPRRYGFHAGLKAPFRLAPDVAEPMLLRHLMRFAGSHAPFELPGLDIVRVGSTLALARPSLRDRGRACRRGGAGIRCVPRAFTEAELERCDPGDLTALQFANLYRWGNPFVLQEFRFHMALTGPLLPGEIASFERALREHFAPYLGRSLEVANLALFVEDDQGAPFHVHSLHPMGRVTARRSA